MIITITMKMSISSINITMWLLLIPRLKRNGYHCLWYCCNYFNDKQNKNVLPYQQCFLSQLINIITYMLSMVKRGNCKWWQRWDTLFFFYLIYLCLKVWPTISTTYTKADICIIMIIAVMNMILMIIKVTMIMAIDNNISYVMGNIVFRIIVMTTMIIIIMRMITEAIPIMITITIRRTVMIIE